jgi:hypothetical protein
MIMYKIFIIDGIWEVYSGYLSSGYFTREDLEFWSKSIADCYAWIKAKEEGLLA